jgi:hypothetical protein
VHIFDDAGTQALFDFDTYREDACCEARPHLVGNSRATLKLGWACECCAPQREPLVFVTEDVPFRDLRRKGDSVEELSFIEL